MASIAGLRYIKPLFELAKEKSLTDEVHEGIKAFGRVLEDQVNEGSGELEAILLNPRIPAAQKKAILMKMTEGDFPQLLKEFFCLLVDKGRGAGLPVPRTGVYPPRHGSFGGRARYGAVPGGSG